MNISKYLIMSILSKEKRLKKIIELCDKHDITAYEIGNSTSLNASGIQRLLDNKVKKPHEKTLTIIENDGSMPPVIIDSTEVTNPEQPEVEGDLYCEMYGKNSTYEWIESIEIGTISNVSGNDGGYGDYTNLVTKIEQGEAHEIKLTPAFSGGSYVENWSVFIDWNGDGEFKDGELVFKTMQPTPLAFSAALEVPADAILGDTRMRISMRYKKSNYHGCGKFDWGEVEDYTVKVVESDGIDNGVDIEDPEISFPDLPDMNELDSLVFDENMLDSLDFAIDDDFAILDSIFMLVESGGSDFDSWDDYTRYRPSWSYTTCI